MNLRSKHLLQAQDRGEFVVVASGPEEGETVTYLPRYPMDIAPWVSESGSRYEPQLLRVEE